MLDSKGFDLWADGYDKSVILSEQNDEYPFAGYHALLNDVYSRVLAKPGARVLDIGFGTGMLTSALYRQGCRITGIDFSERMVAIAQEKMPEAALYTHDFSLGLPAALDNAQFDFIISTYAIHHLDDTEKTRFLGGLAPHLAVGGEILIGDVSFTTPEERERCRQRYADEWDESEHYFAASELIAALEQTYLCEYRGISHYAGVLSLRLPS